MLPRLNDAPPAIANAVLGFVASSEIALVVGETEGAVAEGLAAIKADYEMLEVFVDDENLAAAESAKRANKAGGKVQLKNEPAADDKDFEEKELARLFKEAATVVDGITVASPTKRDHQEVAGLVRDLLKACHSRDLASFIHVTRLLVPEWEPSQEFKAIIDGRTDTFPILKS